MSAMAQFALRSADFPVILLYYFCGPSSSHSLIYAFIHLFNDFFIHPFIQ